MTLDPKLVNETNMDKSTTSGNICKKTSTKRCNVTGCNERITLIGQVCSHCDIKFCLSHCSIEGHSCSHTTHYTEQLRKTTSMILENGKATFSKLNKI